MIQTKAKWSRLADCFRRKPNVVLFLLPCFLLATLYVVSENNGEYPVSYPNPSYRFYNDVEGTMSGYLVWNSKCHMLAKDALDPSITKFVKREKFEACYNGDHLTRIFQASNDTVLLLKDVTKLAHKNVSCCWSPVLRPSFDKAEKQKFDSIVTVKQCQNLDEQVTIPKNVDVVMVSCKERSEKKNTNIFYENVHAVLNRRKVYDRLERNVSDDRTTVNSFRKLSILVLGIDSVSRLNFQRTMPLTAKLLREDGWVALKGYNKMGDNTFPNLMAILTGQNQQQAYTRCKPTEVYKLDRCPFLWYNFRNAGYVTAYGEDESYLSTFNYLKVGFVDPPTDYYLRPYVIASEKLLKTKKRFNLKYCTGPEMSFDRIFNFATDFARMFLSVPYFGFFWTNSISHDNMNGLSLMDSRMLSRLQSFRKYGILNDTMIVFLSDHGMRWGAIRNTFIGWYEERLPFVYLWLPEWFRAEYPLAYQALKTNENRLTSPYDLYETFRDVLITAGGEAESSSGCPSCQSLFEAVPMERGCQDAGIAAHWCTCTAFKAVNTSDTVITEGVQFFLEHIENIIKEYKSKNGKRLCAKLKLKKIHRVDRIVDLNDSNSTSIGYFYMVQLTPGDGKFEFTIRYHTNGSSAVSDHEVSRINPYAASAKCLNHGMKQYCHCIK